MDSERWQGLVDHELGHALSAFKDVMNDDEAAQDIRRMCEGDYSHTIESDIRTIKNFLESDPDPLWVRDFVEWEMNYNLGDSTGKAHLEWIRHALNLMEDVFKEYESKESLA